MVWRYNKRQYSNKTLTLKKSMLCERASLRKCSHFHNSETVISFNILLDLVQMNCLSAYMYQQNSEKALLRGNCPPPPPSGYTSDIYTVQSFKLLFIGDGMWRLFFFYKTTNDKAEKATSFIFLSTSNNSNTIPHQQLITSIMHVSYLKRLLILLLNRTLVQMFFHKVMHSQHDIASPLKCSGGSRGGGGRNRHAHPPPKIGLTVIFYNPFCIRMLKNRAQIALESIKNP